MGPNEWEERRILIWGKTYPELSVRYAETVCTGGTDEDGNFIRLYPIPFRYLSEESTFKKYQWIKARIRKAHDDNRRESYRILPDSIEVGAHIPTDKKGWLSRKRLVLSNCTNTYSSAEELFSRQLLDNTSIGFVKPGKITKVFNRRRPQEDIDKFIAKQEAINQRLRQESLFALFNEREMRDLMVVPERIYVQWQCSDSRCNGHEMAILDWEIHELIRKRGLQTAVERAREILMSGEYEVGFFLSNFKAHPRNFAIAGLWYPKKLSLEDQSDLFGYE